MSSPCATIGRHCCAEDIRHVQRESPRRAGTTNSGTKGDHRALTAEHASAKGSKRSSDGSTSDCKRARLEDDEEIKSITPMSRDKSRPKYGPYYNKSKYGESICARLISYDHEPTTTQQLQELVTDVENNGKGIKLPRREIKLRIKDRNDISPSLVFPSCTLNISMGKVDTVDIPQETLDKGQYIIFTTDENTSVNSHTTDENGLENRRMANGTRKCKGFFYRFCQD